MKIIITFCLVFIYTIGFGDSIERKILLQPTFHYTETGPVAMGKGFVIEGPEKTRYIITSSHLFYFYSDQLEKITWEDFSTGLPIAESIESVGSIGIEPIWTPLNLTSDFAVFEAKDNFPVRTLTVDSRKSPIMGEEIWFPYSDDQSPDGYKVVAGRITESSDLYLRASLNEEIIIQARSGSPVFTKSDNKVIGVFTGGSTSDGQSSIIFCPISNVIEHLLNFYAKDRTQLQ